MKTSDRSAFDADVVRALGTLGAKPSDPAVDALANPRAAAEALEVWRSATAVAHAPAPILLRLAPEHDDPVTAYGPTPADLAWACIDRGSPMLSLASLRMTGAEQPARLQAEHIEIDTATTDCCGAATCNRNKSKAAAWLVLQSKPEGQRARWLVTEAVDSSANSAREKVDCVAARLAQGMGLPLRAGQDIIAAERLSPPPLAMCRAQGAPLLPAACIARHALRSEADRVVLRDHASRGPRAVVGRTAVTGFVLLAIAIALWVWTAAAARQGHMAVTLAIGAAATLFSLAAYAFLGVARFAARYGAQSSPLVWIGADRVVVAPWVNRHGAIDLRPEGRLGAAIRLGEVRAVSVTTRGDHPVVELDTAHGSIDVLSTDRAETAAFWCDALRRSIDEARHVSEAPAS